MTLWGTTLQQTAWADLKYFEEEGIYFSLMPTATIFCKGHSVQLYVTPNMTISHQIWVVVYITNANPSKFVNAHYEVRNLMCYQDFSITQILRRLDDKYKMNIIMYNNSLVLLLNHIQINTFITLD